MPHYEPAPSQYAPTSLPNLGVSGARPPAASKPPMPPVPQTPSSRATTRRLGLSRISMTRRGVDPDTVFSFLFPMRGGK